MPHMHENQKLIGASKAEDHMTKCAIQDVYELHQYSQVPAAFCGPCSEVCFKYSFIELITNGSIVNCNLKKVESGC